MPIVRNIQKHGNSACIILTSDTLAQLGASTGDEVAIEFVGDTMIVRRSSSPAPDAWKVLTALAALENAPRAADGRYLSDARQRALVCLRAYGPSTPSEVAHRLGMSRTTARDLLLKLVAAGLVRRVGDAYELVEGALLP